MEIQKEVIQAFGASRYEFLVGGEALQLEDGGTFVAHGMEAVNEEPGSLKELRAPVEHVLSFLAVEIVDHHELVKDLLGHPLIEYLEEVLPALWGHHTVPAIAHCMQAAANKKASCVLLGSITPDLFFETEELRLSRICHWIIPFCHLFGVGNRIDTLEPREDVKTRKAPHHARQSRRGFW